MESALQSQCSKAEQAVHAAVNCQTAVISSLLRAGQKLFVTTRVEFRVVEDPAVRKDVRVFSSVILPGTKDRLVDNRELTETEWSTLSNLQLRSAHQAIVNFFHRTGNKAIAMKDFAKLSGVTEYYSFNTRLKNELGILFAVRNLSRLPAGAFYQ